MFRQLGKDIWCAEDDLFMPGKFHFPCRMTVCRLAGKKLLVHSPISLTEPLANALEELGAVSWLVAPNCFHHLRLGAWSKRWPTAELWGAPGLASKRPDLSFTGTLGEKEPQEWLPEVVPLLLSGAPKMQEVVFFHQPSKTLIVTDLVFNVKAYKNKRSWLIYAIAGTHKNFGQSRLWRMLVKDRERFAEGLSRMFSWDFSRLVMAHGQIIESEGKSKLSEALTRWLKTGKTNPGKPVPSRSSNLGGSA